MIYNQNLSCFDVSWGLRIKEKVTGSRWNGENGKPLFWATVSGSFPRDVCWSALTTAKTHQTRSTTETNSCNHSFTFGGKWVHIVPLLYNPGPHVTVDIQRTLSFQTAGWQQAWTSQWVCDSEHKHVALLTARTPQNLFSLKVQPSFQTTWRKTSRNLPLLCEFSNRLNTVVMI